MKRTLLITSLSILAIMTFTAVFACARASAKPETVEMTYISEQAVNTTPAGPKTAMSTIEETLGLKVTRIDDYQVKGDVYHVLMLDQYDQNALIARVIKPSKTDVRFIFMADADSKCAEAQNICKSYVNSDVAIAPDEELFNKVNSNDFEFAYRQGDEFIDCYMKKQSICSSVWTIDTNGNLSLFWYNRNDPEIAKMYENQ